MSSKKRKRELELQRTLERERQVSTTSPIPQRAGSPSATLLKPSGTAVCQSSCGRAFDLAEGLQSEGTVLMIVHGMAIPFWCPGCGKTICTDCMAKEQGDAITSGSAVSLNLRCGCGGRREMLVTTEYLRVMEEAEKPDSDADHESSLDVLGDRNHSVALMEREHKAALAEGGSRLVRCAVAWLDFPGNKDRIAAAVDALARSVYATDSLFWDDAAAARKLLGDGGDRRFMELASSYAKTARDHMDCALPWAIWLKDEAKARACLQSAAKLAETCNDWIILASKWRILLSEPGEALRCVGRATKLVEDPYQWGLCADEYDELGKKCRAGLCRARSKRKA